MSLREQNREVLRQIEQRGGDLTFARPVEFAVIFPDRSGAAAFADRARKRGFDVAKDAPDRDADPADPRLPFEIVAGSRMVPGVDAINATEEILAELAAECGGRVDGWVFQGQPDR